MKDGGVEIGTAIINDGVTKITLMESYSVINTMDYGEIHLEHHYLDSLTIIKIDNDGYKAFYKPKPKFSIIISNIKSGGNDIKASFRINLPNFSEDENQTIKIHLIKKAEELLSGQSDKDYRLLIIKKYILPLIHDFLADMTAKMHMGDSCIEKAVKACGKNNIKFVDVGLFASGCSYECK